MRSYWLKIVLGALATFGVGMLIWTGVQRGQQQVKRIATSIDPITIPLPFIPFIIDGREEGRFQEVQVLRSAPKEVASLRLVAKLADTARAAAMAACAFTPEADSGRGTGPKERINVNGTHIDRLLHCADSATAVAGALVPFGTVVVVREGAADLVRPLLLPADVVHDLRHMGDDHPAPTSANARERTALEREMGRLDRSIGSLDKQIARASDGDTRDRLMAKRAVLATQRDALTARERALDTAEQAQSQDADNDQDMPDAITIEKNGKKVQIRGGVVTVQKNGKTVQVRPGEVQVTRTPEAPKAPAAPPAPPAPNP